MILNTFPDLLTFGTLSPFILRVVIGLIILDLGILKFGREHVAWQELFDAINLQPSKLCVKILAFTEVIGGLMLIAGSYVQLTAMVFTVLFFIELILEYRQSALEKRDLTFYILMFSVSLSLVFLGAGAFAFDIPL